MIRNDSFPNDNFQDKTLHNKMIHGENMMRNVLVLAINIISNSMPNREVSLL